MQNEVSFVVLQTNTRKNIQKKIIESRGIIRTVRYYIITATDGLTTIL